MGNKLYDVLAKLTAEKKYSINVEENVVLTKEQLGELISSDYIVSTEALENGQLVKAFEAADKETANIVKKDLKKGVKPEVIIFNLQYALNPSLPFSYKETICRSIEKLGETIWEGKNINEDIKEAISLGLVSKYLTYKKMESAKEGLFENVKLAENYYSENEELAYYLTGLYLYNKPSYKYCGKKFTDLALFYNKLMKERKMIDFAEKFEKDCRFLSWLYYLGKGDVIVAWKKEIEKLDSTNQNSNEVANKEEKKKNNSKKEKAVEKAVKDENKTEELGNTEANKE